MKRTSLLIAACVLTLSLTGGCTATPINLPGVDSGGSFMDAGPTNNDLASMSDQAGMDGAHPPPADSGTKHDGEIPDGAVGDGLDDGLTDGLNDGPTDGLDGGLTDGLNDGPNDGVGESPPPGNDGAVGE